MAGSLNHLIGESGGWSLIEDMGDAHEAVEELLWLVLRTMTPEQAKNLIDTEFYPMYRHERERDSAFEEVRKRMTN